MNIEREINEHLSIWTQELLGVYSIVICRYIHMYGVEDTSDRDFPLIIETFSKMVENKIGASCIFMKLDDGRKSDRVTPLSYLFFRIGKYGIGPREIEKTLPSIKETDLNSLGLGKGCIKILSMDGEYDQETNLHYHKSIGYFRISMVPEKYQDHRTIRDMENEVPDELDESDRSIKKIYSNMKHLYEFSNFMVRPRRPSLFRPKGAVLMLHCELNNAKVLVVADFVEYLISIGIKAEVNKTALEEEDYEISIDNKIPLEEIINSLPSQAIGDDTLTTSNLKIWYRDDPNNIAEFTWGWGKGIYRG